MTDERKAYIYVGKDINGSLVEPMAYKIGSTYDVEQRQRSGYIGDVLFTVECDNRAAAFTLEFKLHRYFNYRAVPNRNEWFYLIEDEIELIRGGFDGTVIVTDFMLMFTHHHMNRHASAAESFKLKLSYRGRINQIRRSGGLRYRSALDIVIHAD